MKNLLKSYEKSNIFLLRIKLNELLILSSIALSPYTLDFFKLKFCVKILIFDLNQIFFLLNRYNLIFYKIINKKNCLIENFLF